MILIVSEDNDQSTVDVIKWLVYTKKEFFRINPNDRVNVCQYNGEGFIIKVNNYFTINTADISAFWYRRGFIFLPHQYPNDKFDSIANFHVAIKSEIQTLRDLLHYNLKQRKSIGSSFESSKEVWSRHS